MSASQVTSNLAECFGDELPDLDQSMWDMFYGTAKKHPCREAIVSMWQPKEHLQNLICENTPQSLEETKSDGSGDVMRWSYADLLVATERVSSWLQSQGCAQGQRLVVFLWNSTEWVLFFWVAARMRMTYIPLDPRSMENGADEYIGLLQPSVLVAQNGEAATILENSCSQLKDVRIRISCTKSPFVSWTSLSALSASQPTTQPVKNGDLPGQELALIIFTSGTTSVPKGCLHTATNLWSATHDWDPETNTSLVEKWLVHTPVSHIFAVNNSLRAWRYGGSVVFASKSFDISTSLNALEAHQCTRMSAIPTLVQALLSHPKFPGKESLALRYVSLGGTLIREEDAQMCRRLGSDAVIQAYGMSEGAPTTSWTRNDPLLASGHYPGVGKVLPGCRLRVCALGSQTPLNRNVPGELHMGGTSVITGYLNGTDPDSFYTDECGSWLKTGDQALIDGNGVLQILGRYKDLIIRGGENISPAKIESHLSQLPGIFAQVVGIPDETAGEVPVAVVRSLGSSTKAEIAKLVENLGSIYTLAAIITLEELGIKHYPTTSSGKIRKDALKQLVHKHLISSKDFESLYLNDSKSTSSKTRTDSLSSPSPASSQTSNSIQLDPPKSEQEPPAIEATIQQLISIWTSLMVVAPNIEDSVLVFADSITLLRYCDKVWRTLGKKLYLQDFLEHETIKQHARLLESRETFSAQPIQPSVPLSAGEMVHANDRPPRVADMAHANGDPYRFIETQISSTRILKDLGLAWETDVEDIIPIKDSFIALADGPRPQSFRHRMAFKIVDRDSETVRRVLEKGLSSQPMFRTILVKLPDGALIHVVVRPGKTLYDILITEQSMATDKVVQEMIIEDSSEVFSRIQMFQAVIAKTENSINLILTYNHSVFDAMSMIPWIRDLDILMANPAAELLPSTPFKLYADMTYTQQTSLPATLDVQYMVQRLSGIGNQTKAFWPPQRVLDSMVANDKGSEHQLVRMKADNSEPMRYPLYPRVVTISKFPHLQVLKSKNIQPVIVVKTAIALFNIQQTGQNHAIFTNIDAGRSWPFIPSWVSLPPAMSIDGPTLEFTLNMFRILPDETVGTLLQRVRDDQNDLSSHAHAPLFKVLDGLKGEGPLVKDALLRQVFNWDISLSYLDGFGEDLVMLKPFGRVDWPDGEFWWEAGMVNSDELCVLATWNNAQLGLEEVEGYVRSLNRIIEWITAPENWVEPVGIMLGRN